jgi:preprotein translocase SecA subunit
MANILTRVFGSANDRLLKKLQLVVREVADLEDHFKGLAPEEFPVLTKQWKEKLAAEETTLDEILPEAFAAVREASRRTIGLRHYDVQVLGGIVLHQGKIAEMKTGEGKTLVATLALYLNALTGKGAHLVTVNDYLARRDVQWMGPIYHFLGLEVGSIIHDASFIFDPLHLPKDYRFLHLRPVERRDAYRADITYGTNNEFGFDYLRDNLKFSLDEYAQRELNFAIVDEVDNILIDEARTPLIISGPAEESTEKYGLVDRIIPRLQRNVDYTIDEKHKNVTLTEEGVAKAERLLGVANLYDPTQIDMLHHVTQGLRAHTLFKRDVDYIVKEGEVIIVDEFTGRLMPGRRWSDGLHQAVEAKEGVRIERENQTLATITIQNYFRMYGKLAGMTGTADTESVEFQKTYKLDVVVIPPNLVMCRDDHADVVYKTEREKFQAVVEEVRECNAKGQPVLVGTTSVEKSESVSKLLKKAGVRHSVLNAINHEAEANIIAQAGRHAQVTIATNMAGRGTDILLGGNAEYLARAEMENEWLREARSLAGTSEEGQQARRYEDALRELRDTYNARVSQAEHEHAEKLAAVEATREEAFRALIEAHAGILDGAACGKEWERHERSFDDDVPNAIDNRVEVPARYLATAEKLHGALLAEDDRIARALGEKFGREGSTMFAPERAVLKDRFAAYEEVLRKWNTDESARGPELGARLLERGGAYRFWTRVMQLALVVKPEQRTADARRALEAYQEAWSDYGARYERFCEEELPRHRDALRAAEQEFESARTNYEAAIQEIREKIEKAPHAYDERFQEMLVHYKEICAAEREQVVAAGGLHILGTERHEARRIDNQLRGRAGRQGDPGSSRFYLSLEDDLLRIFGADRMQNLMQQLGMEEGVPIEHRFVTRAIRNAQEKVEGHNFDIRKHLLEYDDVLNKQREVIYARRRELLTKEDLREDVVEMAENAAGDVVAAHFGGEEPAEGWDWKAFDDAVFAQFNLRLNLSEDERHELDARRLEGVLRERAVEAYRKREEQYGAPICRYLERLIWLQTVDTLWREHLLSMEHLKEGIGLRGYGQKNPLQEYQKEGYDLFEELVRQMESDTVEKLWSVQVHVQQGQAVPVPGEGATEASAGMEPPPALPPELVDAERRRRQAAQQTQTRMRLTHGEQPSEPPKTETVRRDGDKIGRNEPCPCGSGKKYKKCHGQAA